MRPAARMGLLIVLTIGGILPVATFLTVPSAHGMVRFNSYLELQRFLLLESSCRYDYGTSSGWVLPETSRALPAALSTGYAASSADSAPVNAVPSHSETNNQVSGVDELDTVKSDGQYIYTVTNNTVAIVDAYPVNNAQLVSRISVGNQSIDGIFVSGRRLSIVTEAPRNFYYGYASCGGPLIFAPSSQAGMVPQCMGCYNRWVPEQNTSVIVYDLTNHYGPTLQTTLTVNGTFVGSRRIGDMVYLVSSGPARYNDTLPAMVLNGQRTEIPVTQIYHSDVGDKAFSYTTVVALNMIQDNASPIVQSYLLGTSSTIYVSLTNIFLTQPVWDGSGETVIHRVSIMDSKINYEASGIVPGHVLNQFSMDEDNGHFRVVTSNNGFSVSMVTSVYVLDMSMKIIGALDGISPGETFHAARFMGDRAYLVTFKRTDPLFVIDLKDPAKPTLLGQLNVTGVSDYLQPYDGSHLIGIGKSAQDVAWENAALFLGLKLSLFDVTDPHKPVDLSDFTIGERGTNSPALTDQKAVLFEKSLNLLVIPIEVWGQPPASGSYGGYYPYSQAISQGAYVFHVSPENGIVFIGAISHFPDQVPVNLAVSAYYVTRSLYIGNVLYTISGAMVKMNNLTDLSSLGSIDLV